MRKIMSKIKVAFFISNLGQGGAERQFVELIKGIDKTIFEVYLILYAYQKEAFYNDIFAVGGITISIDKLKKKKSVLKIIEALLYIRRVLKNNKFDILFSTLFMNNLFIRISAPRKYKNKIIANSRNSILLYSKYHLFVERFLIRNSYLVFNSKDALQDFKNVFSKKYHPKLRVIYNGFEIHQLNKGYNNNDNNKIVIGGLGRQSHQKNFIQLTRVFLTSTKETDKSLKLFLQGSKGDETQKILDIIKDNDNVFLRESDTQIEKFFNEIHIMVLPSHFEGCPNVLFEAMIYKRLCVISKGANSDDFVIDGVNGFVYDGSDEGLKRTLIKAISIIGTEREKEIIDNAYNYVKNNFSMETMIKKYEQLFLEIYEKNKSSH